MVKIQKLVGDHYALKARSKDATKGMQDMIKKMGTKKSAENDQVKCKLIRFLSDQLKKKWNIF